MTLVITIIHLVTALTFSIQIMFESYLIVFTYLERIKFGKSTFYIQQNSRLESATEFVLPKHLLRCLSMNLLQMSVQLLRLLAENIYLMMERILL